MYLLGKSWVICLMEYSRPGFGVLFSCDVTQEDVTQSCDIFVGKFKHSSIPNIKGLILIRIRTAGENTHM